MYPVPPAGDVLQPGLPLPGAGSPNTNGAIPFSGGGGLGSFIPSEATIIVLNETTLIHNGMILKLITPAEEYADRVFITAQEGTLTLNQQIPNMSRITPITPGAAYIVDCDIIDDSGIVYFTSYYLIVPTTIVDSEGRLVASKIPRKPHLLESLTFAIGKVVQSLNGVPSCRSIKDADLFDTFVFVNSTLGFTRQGYFFTQAGLKIEYVDKCDTAFLLKDPLISVIYGGEILVADVKSVPPRREQ